MRTVPEQRWAGVAAALPACLAAIVFWRPSLDVFNTVKATVVVGGAVLLLASAVAWWALGGAADQRRSRRPSGPWVVATGVFTAALGLGVAVSTTPLRSIVGAPGRHGGLALYVACAILGLTAACADEVGRRRAGSLLVLTSVPVVVYALVQAAGADPLPWVTVEGGVPVFSTFGNVDFASAWMGIVGVLAVGMAVSPARPAVVRRGAAALALATAVAVVATGSLQGPVVLAVGGAAVLLVRFAGAVRWTTRRVVVAAVVGSAVVAALAGPAGLVGDAARSLATRVPKWAAAVDIAADAPIAGRGLDTYGDWFFAARAPDVAAESGLRRSVDNAHDVPLHLLAGGGVVLLAAWAALVVVLPAVGVWRRRAALWGSGAAGRAGSPAEGCRIEDVAVVAAWAGYLLQALVSIDVPPLAALGFLLTGMVAGIGGLVTVRPAAPAREEEGDRRARRRAGGPARTAVAVVAVALAVAAVVPLTRPLRADLAGWRAELARVAGEEAVAAVEVARASTLAPWDGRYDADHAAWLAARGQLEAALGYQRRALDREPRSLAAALNLARVLVALGRRTEATAAYALVAQLDPHTPAVQQEIAAHLAGSVGPPAALDPAAPPPGNPPAGSIAPPPGG